MPKSYNPRFATPGVIASVDDADLFMFLKSFAPALRGLGLRIDGPDAIDREALSILILEGTRLPDGMLERICDLDEVARPCHRDALRALASDNGLAPDPSFSGHQLAVRVMNIDLDGVDDLLAETGHKWLRQFDRIMATTPKIPGAMKRTRARLDALGAALDEAFIRLHRQRDRGVVRVIAADETHGFRLSIRRGDVRRNQAVLDDADERVTKLMIHRPEVHDLIRYDARYGDLLIGPRAEAERMAFAQLVGLHLFKDRFMFDVNMAPPRYTLSPILEEGPGCMLRGLVAGVAELRLDRLQFRMPGYGQPPITIGPGDVFAGLAAFGGRLDPRAKLMCATLKIRPRGSRKELSAMISPPWGARYEREDAGELIEEIIERIGFLLSREMSLHGTPATLFSVS